MNRLIVKPQILVVRIEKNLDLKMIYEMIYKDKNIC